MSTPESSLQSLFEALIDAAPDERESTIRSSGLPETDQRALLRMLQADDRLGDSKEPSLRQHPWPGDAVGDYRLIAPIGNGGMGNVWQAHSLSTPGLVVAVKFANWTRDEHTESAERLAQEGRILAAMKHPGIVSVFASGVTATGRPYLVLDELPGPTLDAFLNQRRHSAWDLAQIMLRLCDAVVAAHQAGVIHRDIKPANVIIIGGLSPVLVDFGAALVLPHGVIDSTHVTQGASPMTPAFASPEQSRGEQATPATDVFALGRIIKLAVQSLSDPTSATTRLLDAVATRACSDDPVDRYPHAQALADDLSERLAGLKQRLPSSTGRWKRSTALAVASALAIGLGMGAVAHAWFWSNRQIIEAGEEHFGFETIEDALDEIAETVDDQNDDATLRLVAETPWHELDGSADQRLMIAQLKIDAGLTDGIFMILEEIEPGELPDNLRLQHEWLRVQAETVPWSRPQPELVRRLLREAMETGSDHVERSIVLHGVSLGEPDLVQLWLEWDDPAALDLWEADSEAMYALLSLSNRLVISGLIDPLEEEILDAVTERIDTLREDDDSVVPSRSLVHLRTLALERTARLLAVSEDDHGDVLIEEWPTLLASMDGYPADLALTYYIAYLRVFEQIAPSVDPDDREIITGELRMRIADALARMSGDADVQDRFMGELLESDHLIHNIIAIENDQRQELRGMLRDLDDDIWWLRER